MLRTTADLIVGMVNATSGVTVTDATDDNMGDNILLIAGSPLTVNNDVTNNDGGNIELTTKPTIVSSIAATFCRQRNGRRFQHVR